ncbi:DUF4395 domain-containing protein [Aquibacillus sp. 3ASR75-11]|uniref:DUF4395 domain-containing protein n=1 Tax=Terrihalobacillus insolitus TaxID=2950438 RepID=A0A9X4ALE9_9BACI|nr:DUF4395 domain-containing protein [Terrihalobacillus insolitus]MDC3414721.1 DUF4395 domain-containing protein [Terrihalobacillus insolitus]MDC3424166.1 DUF4395 domain-containing protein [Terrihalobacillus insolitus]
MTIPKPLVQVNQSFIVITVVLALFIDKSILLLPFLIGTYTLMTRINPIIQLGKKLLSKPLDQYVQEDKDQQMFNQWIATICLGLSLILFYFNFSVLGYLFSMMVIVAAGVALMGYCIGCTIRYRYIMWKHKRIKLHN